MTRSAIEAAIPHRKPMLLLDEIVSQGEAVIRCRTTFVGDEFFFQGHYPDFPLVPGVILCEAAMQSGAVLLSGFAKEESGVPVAGRMSDVKFKKMIRPGDTIEIETQLNERLADAFFLSSKVTCEGKLAATLSYVVTLAKPS